MNITDLPQDYAGFERLLDTYEAEHFAFDPGGRRVADATMQLMTTFPPTSLLPTWLAKRFAFSLMDEPLLRAFRYPGVTGVEKVVFRGAMKARALLRGFSPPAGSPSGSRSSATSGATPRATRSTASAPSATTRHRTLPVRSRIPVKRSTEPAGTASVTSGRPRDFLAVATLFAVNGLSVGVFGGTLPGQQVRLDLTRIQLSGLLVAAALFAVLSMNLSGAFADRAVPVRPAWSAPV